MGTRLGAGGGGGGTADVQLPKTLLELVELCNSQVRLDLLLALVDHERDVTSLVAAVELDMPTVSHQLRVLRDAAAVLVTAEGQRRIYHLGPAVTVMSRGARVRLWLHAQDGAGLTLDVAVVPKPSRVQVTLDRGQPVQDHALRDRAP